MEYFDGLSSEIHNAFSVNIMVLKDINLLHKYLYLESKQTFIHLRRPGNELRTAGSPSAKHLPMAVVN